MAFLLQQFLQSHFIRTLSWTLFHTLWQAALFAGSAGLAMHYTRDSRPSFRYNILGFIFLAFTGVVVATFIFLWTNHSTNMQLADRNERIIFYENLGIVPIFQSLLRFFKQYSPWLFGIWLVIFSWKSIGLIYALKDIYRVHHAEVSTPDEVWQHRFRELIQRLNLHNKIQLIESKLVKIPATVGCLKPLILLPFGLLSQLPPDQIEAILLHELAHIKRNDFLSNSFQKIMETIFFFNPFLLWISKLLKEEREHCCDEIVLVHTKDKKILINALISFREYQLAPLKLYLNFGNNKQQLLQRVKRMVSKQNKVLSYGEKIFVAASLVLFTGMSCSVCHPGNYFDYDAMIIAGRNQQGVAAKYQKIILPDAVIESVNLSNSQDTLKVALAITDDLIQNGIIKTREALYFQLNDDALIVNGIRQAGALHEQLKSKYIHEQGWTLWYKNRNKPASDNNMT